MAELPGALRQEGPPKSALLRGGARSGTNVTADMVRPTLSIFSIAFCTCSTSSNRSTSVKLQSRSSSLTTTSIGTIAPSLSSSQRYESMICALGLNRLIRLTVVLTRCSPAPHDHEQQHEHGPHPQRRAITAQPRRRIRRRCRRLAGLPAWPVPVPPTVGGGQSWRAAGRNRKMRPTADMTPMAVYSPKVLIGTIALVHSEINPSDVVPADNRHGSQAALSPRSAAPLSPRSTPGITVVVHQVDRGRQAGGVNDRGHGKQHGVHDAAGERDQDRQAQRGTYRPRR